MFKIMGLLLLMIIYNENQKIPSTLLGGGITRGLSVFFT